MTTGSSLDWSGFVPNDTRKNTKIPEKQTGQSSGRSCEMATGLLQLSPVTLSLFAQTGKPNTAVTTRREMRLVSSSVR